MDQNKVDVKVDIGVAGAQGLRDARDDVSKLGETATPADQAARKLGETLDALGAKKAAVATVRDLSNSSGALAIESAEAEFKLKQLAAAMEQAAQEAQSLARQEAAARDAAAAAKRDLDEQRQALADLRTQYTGAARQSTAYREANQQLQVTVRELRRDVADKGAAVTTATTAAREAGRVEADLGRQYAAAGQAAIVARGAVDQNALALAKAQTAVQALGIETDQLAAAERNLDAAMGQVRAELDAMAPALARQAQASATATRSQVEDQNVLRAGLQGIGEDLRRIQGIAALALGGSMVGGLIKDVAATADEFKNLQARVRLVTGEGEAFKTSWAGITDVALRTNSALDGTATLFSRLARAGQEAGLGARDAQLQALSLAETINQSIQLSGSSSEASNAALTQLIQGLQSGVLRGDEFNSVMEQAPRLAQALAQGLGLTTGELRRQAEQGVLTSSTVIKALTNQSQAIAAEYGQLPSTVGRSLQNLKTQWELYVGAADNGMVSSQNLARLVDLLARNIDTLVSALMAAGKAWAAIKVASLVVDLYKWVTATTTATTAVQGNTAAVAANTAAHAANAAAQRQSASAGGALAAGANQAAGGLSSLFGAAMRANVYLAVLANAKELGTWIGETAAKWAGWGKVLQDSEAKLKAQEEATKAVAASQRQMAAALQEARDKQFELSKEAAGAVAKFQEMRRSGDSAAEAISKIGADFDLASVPGIRDAGAVLDKLVSAGEITAGQFQAVWANALKDVDLGVFETQAAVAFGGAAREAERMAAVMDASAREAIRRTGQDFDRLAGGIGAASRSAINDTEAIVRSLDRLKRQGVDTGTALTASLSKSIQTADSEKALSAIRAQVAQLRRELGDKIADGLLQQATQQAEQLKLKLDEAKPGVNSLEEALSNFGLNTTKQLQDTAKRFKESWDLIKDSTEVAIADKIDAFERYAEAAVRANKGVEASEIALQREILRTRQAAEGRSTAGGERVGLGGGRGTGSGSAGSSGVSGAIGTAGQDGSDPYKPNVHVVDNTAKPNSTQTSGETRAAGNELGTRTAIANFLRSAGVDDEAEAWRIAGEFANSKGDVPYFDNPGQKKYGGDGGTLSQAVVKAAEKYRDTRARQDKAAPPAAPAAATPAPTPAPAPASTTYISNVDLGDWRARLKFADRDSQKGHEELIRRLLADKGVSL